jgi:pyruvate kinase
MMAETCLLAESATCYPPLYDELRSLQPRPTETAETVAIAAVAAASEQNAGAIIVLSTSGNTARLISKYRPSVPIITGGLFSNCAYFGLDAAVSYSKSADLPSDSLAPWLLSVLVS